MFHEDPTTPTFRNVGGVGTLSNPRIDPYVSVLDSTKAGLSRLLLKH